MEKLLHFCSHTNCVPQRFNIRDRQAIDAVKAAVSKPKTPGFCLIECEFPPLAALNKLGDGSLQSANQVDDANLAFGVQLARSLSVVPFAPTVTLLASTAASQRLVQKAQKTYPLVHPLQQGLPSPINKSSVLVLVAPSSTRDYSLAQEMVQEYGATVILVNGLAKTPKSVSGQATMAYYLKPLTYNSQVAGYLVRRYPQAWTTLSSFALSSGRKRTTTVLQTATDADILVPGTNTPDLRAAVRAVQQYVDQQAMAARRGFS
jgi:hypothetical protein